MSTFLFAAAKIFRRRNEGAAEGGVGGIPPRPSVGAPPPALLGIAEASKKVFFSF